jgi:OmpA-OmpF porin, OOP family
MTRALHLFTSPRSEYFSAPPMVAEQGSHEILTPLFFQEGESDLDSSYDEALDDFAAVLGWMTGQRAVEVRGHADDRLTPAAGRALSLARARAVIEALEARGVRPGLLRARGLGDAQPASDGYAPLQRAVNRRVELHLVVAMRMAA